MEMVTGARQPWFRGMSRSTRHLVHQQHITQKSLNTVLYCTVLQP